MLFGITSPHTAGKEKFRRTVSLKRSWRSTPALPVPGSRFGASDAPTATVAPHQKRHDERPHAHEKQSDPPGDRVKEANIGHHQAVDDPGDSRARSYPPEPAGVDTT